MILGRVAAVEGKKEIKFNSNLMTLTTYCTHPARCWFFLLRPEEAKTSFVVDCCKQTGKSWKKYIYRNWWGYLTGWSLFILKLCENLTFDSSTVSLRAPRVQFQYVYYKFYLYLLAFKVISSNQRTSCHIGHDVICVGRATRLTLMSILECWEWIWGMDTLR